MIPLMTTCRAFESAPRCHVFIRATLSLDLSEASHNHILPQGPVSAPRVLNGRLTSFSFTGERSKESQGMLGEKDDRVWRLKSKPSHEFHH